MLRIIKMGRLYFYNLFSTNKLIIYIFIPISFSKHQFHWPWWVQLEDKINNRYVCVRERERGRENECNSAHFDFHSSAFDDVFRVVDLRSPNSPPLCISSIFPRLHHRLSLPLLCNPSDILSLFTSTSRRRHIVQVHSHTWAEIQPFLIAFSGERRPGGQLSPIRFPGLRPFSSPHL